MAVIFLVLSMMFAVLEERGAMLVSGFNTMTEDQRMKYDREKVSMGMRNALFTWFVVFAVGAALYYLVSPYFAIAAFAVWLILFFKVAHWDADKAFAKYRI